MNERRYYAYALLTSAEFLVVRGRAKREGLSMSNYVRRCLNSVALEEGDDSLLLDEKQWGRPPKHRPVPTGTR